MSHSDGRRIETSMEDAGRMASEMHEKLMSMDVGYTTKSALC